MRIAQFHVNLPSPGRKLGGVEVFVHRLSNRLVDRGHDVTTFTFDGRPEDAAYVVARAGRSWLATNRAASLTLASAALNRLPQSRFDVLHFHGGDWFIVRRVVPTVRTFHGSALLEARAATSAKRRVAQGAVFPLELLASRLATLSFGTGAPLPPGYTTHGVLRLAVAEPLAPEELPQSAHPTVLFVGTWDGRKRGRFLAERFAADVLPRHPTAKLIMVSDRCDDAPGLVWVRFPSDAELSRLYRSAWVFCMPSRYEGFGMPYLEAMSHGVPVVATPNPGAELVLRDGAGALTSDAELGATLASILRDPATRARLAAAGRARAGEYSWDRVLGEHEQAYDRAIAAFGSGSGGERRSSR